MLRPSSKELVQFHKLRYSEPDARVSLRGTVEVLEEE